MDLPAHNRASDNVHLIPDGLQQLMSDISREVLRSQPENLYKFISDYLEDLKKYRCLPHKFDSIESYETFSSDSVSSINSFETISPSSSEVESYETFSSSSIETPVESEPECSSTIIKQSSGESNLDSKVVSPKVSVVRSVSTKDTLTIKAAEPMKKESSVISAQQSLSKSNAELTEE